jgi:murein endopeptidase
MTGFIGVGQLRYILTNLGEKMSDEEVDELLKAVDTSSGEINYTGMFTNGCFDTDIARYLNAKANGVMRRSREDSTGELDGRMMGFGRVA